MSSLYYISIVIFSGMLCAKLLSKIKLPNVTGYLIAGVIIGPYVLNIVPLDAVKSLGILSDAALGFIAYGIGSEFSIKSIKKTGKTVIMITVFEALGAVLLVDLAMIFIFKQPLPFSLTLGAIAAATAPAATILVIRQYKAKGDFTTTLLQVVAMDDAVGIIAFGISFAVAQSLIGGSTTSLAMSIMKPIIEILLSIVIGIILGAIFSYIGKRVRGENELLSLTLAFIFFAIGISLKFNVSTLLTCMMLGATITNLSSNSSRFLSIADRFTPPLFIAFFTIAGLELNISVIKSVGVIGLGYMVFRVIGKMLGVYVAASITKAEENVRKYLGLALIPQAGVAIGLSLLAEKSLPPEYGQPIRTIVLAGTVIYELIGPLASKYALIKAGDIK
ncbi:cation:proton antiporter [Clostridium algidicarnis]|uniref:Cation:proton antiporter n=1 Tax=Clostridium algidicarnis TaxID=37659 RepID=A0ABS6C0C8_9CLOT|nr:cation:proton antiporter [Clostridium algidicarnis]MBU3218916.1 cation:proton antiporter [Clostridium algidicarnis]